MSDPTPNDIASSPSTAHYHPLVIVLTAAVAGILFDRYGPLSLGAWCALVAVGLGAWLALVLRRRTVLAGFALLLAVAATAGAWHHCR